LDPTEIQQVLVNIIGNSIEAMEDFNSPKKKIEISSKIQNDVISLTLSDHGPGISEDFAEYIFEPFESNREDALGIGLAISRTLVERNGGQIEFLGNSDSGPTFEISFRVST
ncbi:MAG: ATP-binding protein, partial [Planctomycetota bacterium]